MTAPWNVPSSCLESVTVCGVLAPLAVVGAANETWACVGPTRLGTVAATLTENCPPFGRESTPRSYREDTVGVKDNGSDLQLPNASPP